MEVQNQPARHKQARAVVILSGAVASVLLLVVVALWSRFEPEPETDVRLPDDLRVTMQLLRDFSESFNTEALSVQVPNSGTLWERSNAYADLMKPRIKALQDSPEFKKRFEELHQLWVRQLQDSPEYRQMVLELLKDQPVTTTETVIKIR